MSIPTDIEWISADILKLYDWGSIELDVESTNGSNRIIRKITNYSIKDMFERPFHGQMNGSRPMILVGELIPINKSKQYPLLSIRIVVRTHIINFGIPSVNYKGVYVAENGSFNEIWYKLESPHELFYDKVDSSCISSYALTKEKYFYSNHHHPSIAPKSNTKSKQTLLKCNDLCGAETDLAGGIVKDYIAVGECCLYNCYSTTEMKNFLTTSPELPGQLYGAIYNSNGQFVVRFAAHVSTYSIRLSSDDSSEQQTLWLQDTFDNNWYAVATALLTTSTPSLPQFEEVYRCAMKQNISSVLSNNSSLFYDDFEAFKDCDAVTSSSSDDSNAKNDKEILRIIEQYSIFKDGKIFDLIHKPQTVVEVKDVDRKGRACCKRTIWEIHQLANKSFDLAFVIKHKQFLQEHLDIRLDRKRSKEFWDSIIRR